MRLALWGPLATGESGAPPPAAAGVRGHSAAEAALGLLASRALSSASAPILYNRSADLRYSITVHRPSRNAGRSTSVTRKRPNAAPLDTAHGACPSGELRPSTNSSLAASFSG